MRSLNVLDEYLKVRRQQDTNKNSAGFTAVVVSAGRQRG